MDKPPAALLADFTITQTSIRWNTLTRAKAARAVRDRADNAPMIDLQTIQQAAERLRGQVLLTPCGVAHPVTNRAGLGVS